MTAKTVTLAAAFALSAVPAFAQDSDLVTKGEYLSRAGDCTACHTAPGGQPFAGGYVFKMPMGKIISRNITSSEQFGIGKWSEEEFARAVRKGVRPDGSNLYPAMPYTSYANITDDDMKALYAYFKQVKPVEAAPEEKTELAFPFNLPGAMWGWNMLFARNGEFKSDPALTTIENRGKYLAEGLAHCSTCHTPRNQFLAEDAGQNLAGAFVDGWHAPNITSDKISGVGGWSDRDIVSYLKNGHAEGKAQAGGPMADAVEHSLRFLTDDDATAIAAYLKTVTPVRAAADKIPSWGITQAKPVEWSSFETGAPASNTPGYTDTSTTDGAVLYNNNCASCHGLDGQGSDDHYFPSLTQNTAVGGLDKSNLVMAIANGIQREGADGLATMPAFSVEHQAIHSWLTHDQIASLANYVSAQFGNGNPHLSASDVTRITSGDGEVPFLIRNAKTFAILGMAIAAVAALGLVMFILGRSRRRRIAP
jgi:D-sorbitol dehydrogenase (acceptor)